MEPGAGLASETRKRKGGYLMPTEEEKEAQRQRNRQIAQSVQTGVLQRGLGVDPERHKGPEQTSEEAPTWEGYQPELTDEQATQRMGEGQPTFEGIVQRMAQNYQTSPQYQQLLDQELAQISEQIAQLTQRRNMIEMAKRGQG